MRINGSHDIFGKRAARVCLSIPVHGNRALKLGLLRSLIKYAGLKEQDL